VKKILRNYRYQPGVTRSILKEGIMETVWKLQDAKSQFSKVVQNALKSGPQYVTRRGTKAVVVLSVSDYEKLISNKLSFKDFLHCRMSAFGHFLRCLSMLSVSRPSVFSPVDKGIAATEMTHAGNSFPRRLMRAGLGLFRQFCQAASGSGK